MNVAIDILHISYWNFYKNIIEKLERNNHNVFLFIRERGPLLKVVKKEYSKHNNIITTGMYYSGKKKLLLHLLRIPRLIYYLYKYKIDVVSSDGFFIGLSALFKKIPAILHSDDYEYTFSYKMTQYFSTKMIIPDVFPLTSKKDIHYRGCKEYAYLNRKYFIPKREDISNIISPQDDYVFIRLISKSSLNYLYNKSINESIEHVIDFLNQKKIKVLISSEEEYKPKSDNCILLSPPIINFHSILKYSLFTITEGDTMARESAIMGTPVFYMGGRNMKIHKYFIENKTFIETKDISRILKIIEDNLYLKKRYEKQIVFEDINEIMFNNITRKNSCG